MTELELEKLLESYITSEIANVKSDYETLGKYIAVDKIKGGVIDCISPQQMASNILYLITKHFKLEEKCN